MADKAWKRWERQIAKYIGGERVPVTGRQRGDAPDIAHNWLSVEVKYTSNGLPLKWFEARAQSEASAKHSQLPVQIYAENGMNAGECFIMMRLSDFRDRWL
jgi:hypothetical protein